MRLENKVGIITGAGQGIGRAYALRFAREGARVVVADINEDKANDVAREVQDLGGEGLAIGVDVSDPESVRAMVDRTIERFGSIDILLNNAAIFATIEMKPFEKIGFEEWNRLMAVNLTGTFLCCQAVASHMRERGQGRIINISSSRTRENSRRSPHGQGSGGRRTGPFPYLRWEAPRTMGDDRQPGAGAAAKRGSVD